MQVSSIMRRVEMLEEADAENNNIHRIILTEQWGEDDSDYKECSSYIISQCEAVCDSETFDNALGAAFLAVTGENPLIKKGTVVIHITREIAMQVVDVLTSQGAEVKL